MSEQYKIKSIKKSDKIIIATIIIISIIFIIATCYLIYIYQININTNFALVGDENITLEAGEEYQETGYIANINGKDISSKVNIESNLDVTRIGDYIIEYSLESKLLGIDKTIYRDVSVKDTTAPVITVNSEKKQVIYLDEEFTIPTYTATDNYDGDITSNVQVTSNVDTSKIGTYKVCYLVADSSGNEANLEITVQVKKKKNPYIVVSISKQTLKYYEYDKLVLSSSVVTGINGKTPTGTFKVLNKATSIILKGEDYESFVNYWIAFSGSSFGFHDASWRSSFGGQIYKVNGSHGCVNMPYSKIKKLYSLVAVGTPVYIKK